MVTLDLGLVSGTTLHDYILPELETPCLKIRYFHELRLRQNDADLIYLEYQGFIKDSSVQCFFHSIQQSAHINSCSLLGKEVNFL